jgi:hypothetical protein
MTTTINTNRAPRNTRPTHRYAYPPRPTKTDLRQALIDLRKVIREAYIVGDWVAESARSADEFERRIRPQLERQDSLAKATPKRTGDLYAVAMHHTYRLHLDLAVYRQLQRVKSALNERPKG